MFSLAEVQKSVLRIPVDGPAPNNTLVFVRGYIPQRDLQGADDTHIVRSRVEVETPFQIEGFQQSKAQDYIDNTRISISAYIEILAAVDDGNFVCAIDEVEGFITATGTLGVRASLAEMDDVDASLTMGFYYSAYVLTYEPRAAEFPRTPSKKSLEQAIGIHDRVTNDPPPARDRALIVPGGRLGGAEAGSSGLDAVFAERTRGRAEASSHETCQREPRPRKRR